MSRVTLTPAQTLAEALKAAGLGAGVEEHHLAVRVVNPDTGAATMVWLPDELTDEYIWGPSFNFVMSGAMGTDELVATIKRTAEHW